MIMDLISYKQLINLESGFPSNLISAFMTLSMAFDGISGTDGISDGGNFVRKEVAELFASSTLELDEGRTTLPFSPMSLNNFDRCHILQFLWSSSSVFLYLQRVHHSTLLFV